MGLVELVRLSGICYVLEVTVGIESEKLAYTCRESSSKADLHVCASFYNRSDLTEALK